MKNNTYEPFIWEKLQADTRPVVLYGMGDGADKIYDECERHSIPVCDIFASDEYVRGQSFRGHRVLKFEDICEKYSDCVILLCFAAFREDLLNKIYAISEKYTLFAPDMPLFGGGVFDGDMTNAGKIKKTCDILADEQSRTVLYDIINYKLSGKIDYLRHCETDRDEIFKNIFRFGEHESFLDLGAYTGDTVAEFILLTGGKFDSITALEPDRRNFRKLKEYFDGLSDKRLACYNLGAWDKTCELAFSSSGNRNAHITDTGNTVSVCAADELLNGKRITYIKMDVEGAEAKALLGLRKTLSDCSPALAVSAYHKTCDFFEIPLLIHELCPKHKIYLRHHPYIPAWETNVYAVL